MVPRIFIVLVALASATSPVNAIPKSINLEPMVLRSEVIAVARFIEDRAIDHKQHRVELDLTRILKGDIKPGRYLVTFSDHPSVSPDAPEFIAFFRKGLCWRFAAQPITPGSKVVNSVLAVAGFYDWNAYFVYPGLVTLPQIEALVQGQPITYTFQGPMVFPNRGRPGWHADGAEIEVRFNRTTGAAAIKGLPEFKGMPYEPRVSIGGPFDGRTKISLIYSRDLRSPLTISGEVESWDPKQDVFRTRFVVRDPIILDRKEFEVYASDARCGHSYYRCKLVCAATARVPVPKPLFLTMGKRLGSGEGPLEGWNEKPLTVVGMRYQGPNRSAQMLAATHTNEVYRSLPDKEWSLSAIVLLDADACLVLDFDIGPPGGGMDGFWGRSEATQALLYKCLIGDVLGTVYEYRNGQSKPVTTFTASLDGVYFEKLDQPRSVQPEPNKPGGSSGMDGDDDDECYVAGSGPSAGTLWRWIAFAVVGILTTGILLRWTRDKRAGARPSGPS